MPFRSQAQRAFMYATDPEMARDWERHTPKGKRLPRRVRREQTTPSLHEMFGCLPEEE